MGGAKRYPSPLGCGIDGYRFAPPILLDAPSHSRGAGRPRFAFSFTLQNSEGAGNAGRRLAPAVSCARCTQECAHEHTGTAEAARHSLRSGVTAYAALSLETNSSCLHRQRIDGSHRPVELCKPPPASRQPRAPGPHGFAVRSFLRHQLRPAKCMPAEAMSKAFKRRSSARDARSRKTALRTPLAPDAAASTATRPNVRDDGQRPSWRDGMAGVVGVIWVSREAEYFCGRDWTGQITLKSLWKIMRTRSATFPDERGT
jgi:hypothetical protein